MRKILLIFTLLIVAGLGARWFQFRHTPNPKTVLVYFEEGTSLRRISRLLEKEGVITQAPLFEIYARLSGEGRKLKSGEYEFRTGLKPPQILRMMVKGLVKHYPFTVPEGFTLAEIGKSAIARRITTAEEWSRLTAGKNLEGYLFPDTYLIERRSTGEDLVKDMAALFKKKITPELIQKGADIGFSLHQWVTLASLIEKETGAAAERPLIASVFLNRLQLGMLLQTDPSVIYGIPNFDGNLTRRHLETPGPYNTYINPGLPPGPICSPGLESLKAVIGAPQTDYLYFVSKGDGTHHFSKSLAEHQNAVIQYQLRRQP